ncbi:MAG: endonuclease III [Clostridiales bacterium]|nr:endonuclease III [Clostridiales bacterium]
MHTDDQRSALNLLSQLYADAKPALVFNNEFELLVSVILSAQCTDVRVNLVTKKLFADYSTPSAIAQMDISLLEEYIKSCGLYKNKAKNIKEASIMLCERFGGKVPSTREELMQLPGVGRKTANVVLSVAFGKPAFAVDTHVFRVSNRIGLANGKTPDEVEAQVTALLPEELWGKAHHWLIYHGRKVCHSQKPDCAGCQLKAHCSFYKRNNGTEQ